MDHVAKAHYSILYIAQSVFLLYRIHSKQFRYKERWRVVATSRILGYIDEIFIFLLPFVRENLAISWYATSLN